MTPPRKAASAKPADAPPSEAAADAAIKEAEQIATYPAVLHEMTVFQALRQVMVEIGPIAKDRRVSEGRGPKFNFRGIDDVLNAVHDPFAKWGIIIAPTNWEQVESSIGETKSGTTQLHVRGIHTLTVYGPNGDSIVLRVPAEALDLSDKASSKAMSMAYKYAVIQTLSIPVAAGALDESDGASVPYESHAPQAPPPPPDNVWDKYDEAIANLGLSGREEASAKWREAQGMSFEEFQSAPIERVFAHIRQVVAYARQQEAEHNKQQQAKTEAAPEDTNANADGDAAAGGQ